jgi:hypothetical protein
MFTRYDENPSLADDKRPLIWASHRWDSNAAQKSSKPSLIHGYFCVIFRHRQYCRHYRRPQVRVTGHNTHLNANPTDATLKNRVDASPSATECLSCILSLFSSVLTTRLV